MVSRGRADYVLQVPARSRLTARLRRAAGAAVADGVRKVVQSTRHHDLSLPAAMAALTAHAAGCPACYP